jgi:cystathionine beta-lyase/cystathionine gamma-synthase
MNSITKYIGGHADIIMGVVVVKDDKIFDKLYLSSVYNGASPSPMDCFLALRGVKTLAARMQILCKNGYSISKFLESHPLIEKTIYPGLKSHPQHELAKQ